MLVRQAGHEGRFGLGSLERTGRLLRVALCTRCCEWTGSCTHLNFSPYPRRNTGAPWGAWSERRGRPYGANWAFGGVFGASALRL